MADVGLKLPGETQMLCIKGRDGVGRNQFRGEGKKEEQEREREMNADFVLVPLWLGVLYKPSFLYRTARTPALLTGALSRMPYSEMQWSADSFFKAAVVQKTEAVPEDKQHQDCTF